jgi:hypothetical protein
MFFHEEHSPAETDLFARGVSLLEHQTGMGSCKNISFVSGTSSEACDIAEGTAVPLFYSASNPYNVLLTENKTICTNTSTA